MKSLEWLNVQLVLCGFPFNLEILNILPSFEIYLNT